MMTKWGLGLLFAGVWGTTAWAGESSGGGGAVVCYDARKEITSARLYDYFESDAKSWGFDRQLGAASLSYPEKVRQAIQRFRIIDSFLAGILDNELDFFLTNHAFVGGQLTGISDADPDVLPEVGCEIEQAAMQRTPQVPGDKYFMLSQRIWSALNSDDKAGLVLHELLYKYAREKFKLSNSRTVRYFTAFLSDDHGALPPKPLAYLELMQKLGMKPTFFGYHGKVFNVATLRFYETGDISTAQFADNHDHWVKLRSIDSVDVQIGPSLQFHANGQIKEIKLLKPATLDLNGISTLWRPGSYSFYADGTVASFAVGQRPMFWRLWQQEVELTGGGTFYPDGAPTNLTVSRTDGFHLPIGDFTVESKKLIVDFDRETNITKIRHASDVGAGLSISYGKTRYVAIQAVFGSPGRIALLEGLSRVSYELGTCQTQLALEPLLQSAAHVYKLYSRAVLRENGLPAEIQGRFTDYKKLVYSLCVNEDSLVFRKSNTDSIAVKFHSTQVPTLGVLWKKTLLRFDDGKNHYAQGAVEFTPEGTVVCTDDLCNAAPQ